MSFFEEYLKTIDLTATDFFADVSRDTFGLSIVRVADVFPYVPEGYDLVRRDSWRQVALPKAVHMEETHEFAHYANHLRQRLFGRPYLPFASSELPMVRVLSEAKMAEWVDGGGVLGEYDNDARVLAMLSEEDLLALPDVTPQGHRPWGTDDRKLIRKSVLVHELVHWLQYHETFGDARPWYQTAETLLSMEIEAWTIQAMWLNDHGQCTSIFSRLNDVPETVERLYGPTTRAWVAHRDAQRRAERGMQP